jgi:tetratricopeptide (TPR) repeat protein
MSVYTHGLRSSRQVGLTPPGWKPGLRWGALLVGVAMVAGAGGCKTTAMEAARGNWHQIESAHFRVWTDAKPERGQKLAVDLERFRQVLLSQTTAEEPEAAPPLSIVLPRNREGFRALTHNDEFVGLFQSTPRGNFAFAIASGDSGGRATGAEILFHEYTHHMMAVNGARVPSWYDEGFAEYMSATQFKADGSYTRGCPFQERDASYMRENWLPMGRLMAAEPISALPEGAGDPYLQSWITVHFLFDDPERQARLRSYLQLWATGVPPEQAVRRAFGVDLAAFDESVREYSTRNTVHCIAVTPKRPPAPVQTKVRTLSKAEAYYHVGDVLLNTLGPSEEAHALLRQAADAAPKDAATLASLARLHLMRSDRKAAGEAAAAFAEAERYLEVAQGIAPKLAEVLVLEGHLHRVRAGQITDVTARERSAELKSARKAYRAAIRTDETSTDAYFGLGMTYLLEDNGSEEATVVLEAAAALVPQATAVRSALAAVYLQRGHASEAVAPLEYVVRFSKDVAERKAAQDALAKVQGALQQDAKRGQVPPKQR